jgi:hypothetical protein
MSDYIRYTERPAIEAQAARCNGLIVPVILHSFVWEPPCGRPSGFAIGKWAVEGVRPLGWL